MMPYSQKIKEYNKRVNSAWMKITGPGLIIFKMTKSTEKSRGLMDYPILILCIILLLLFIIGKANQILLNETTEIQNKVVGN